MSRPEPKEPIEELLIEIRDLIMEIKELIDKEFN
jgi:hypothetical protein